MGGNHLLSLLLLLWAMLLLLSLLLLLLLVKGNILLELSLAWQVKMWRSRAVLVVE